MPTRSCSYFVQYIRRHLPNEATQRRVTEANPENGRTPAAGTNHLSRAGNVGTYGVVRAGITRYYSVGSTWAVVVLLLLGTSSTEGDAKSNDILYT